MAARNTPASAAWASTSILFVVWMIAFIDRFILLLLVPGMKATLHISDTQVAILQGPAFSVVFAISGLLMGRLIDTANRRALILAGLIGWSTAAIACGLADSFATLFAARLVIGICQSVLAPASFSLVADLFPPERRGKPISVLTSAATIGASLSQMLGGVLLSVFATRTPLVVPWVGALLPWQQTMVFTAFPGFLVALLFLLVREPSRANRTGESSVPETFALPPFLRQNSRLFGLIFSAFGAQFIVAYGVASWFVVVLMRTGGIPPARAGLMMGGLSLCCGVVAGLLGGWMSDRAARLDAETGRMKLVIAALSIEIVALLPLLTVHVVPPLIVGYVVYSIFGTMIASLSYTILPELVPSAGRGRILALHQFVSILLGMGAGPLLIALCTDRIFQNDAMINFSMLCVAIPCATIAALLLWIALPRARLLRRTLKEEMAGGGPR